MRQKLVALFRKAKKQPDECSALADCKQQIVVLRLLLKQAYGIEPKSEEETAITDFVDYVRQIANAING